MDPRWSIDCFDVFHTGTRRVRASVRSYRDTIRLLLTFVAADKGCRITRLALEDLSFERIVGFPPPPRG